MRKIRQILPLVLLGLTGLTAPAGNADVIYDATSEFVNALYLVGQGSTSPNQPADAFTVSSGPYDLGRISLKLSRDEGSGDFEVRLWDDGGGVPGTIIESWTVDGSLPNVTVVTVESVTEPTLDDGATYWVSVLMPDGVSNGSWVAVFGTADSPKITLSNGESPTWYDHPGRTVPMYLLVESAPEPSRGLLAAGCGLTLAWLAGRRRLQ